MRKKILTTLVLTMAFGLISTSCSSDGDGSGNATGGSSKMVRYKAIASDNAKIDVIAYTNAQGDMTTHTDINATTWESPEISMPASVQAISFGGSATVATQGETGTLKVQIIVNGEVVKENISTGSVMSASTTLY
ncbi:MULTISPECIES: hypothetical protein [unclassified Flavobacterium]|uniref:hypothetical protein n=1 Tax=unclassified Flavobacterium TaxID=196869 RepID=UPI00263541F8|nr:hypothetical protein [Flavobacterium sp.]